NVLDGAANRKYLNFAKLKTGFIVTPSSATAVRSLTITTANDFASRDPASYVRCGAHGPVSSTEHGNGRAETWTEVASGNLSLPGARFTLSDPVGLANSTSYSSYKLIFPTVKNAGNADSMQIADVRFYASSNGTGPNILSEN